MLNFCGISIEVMSVSFVSLGSSISIEPSFANHNEELS